MKRLFRKLIRNRITFCFFFIGCILHEIAHCIMIGIFWPFSKVIRATRLVDMRFNKSEFVMGLKLDDEPKTINDCIIRLLIGIAPLLLMIALILGVLFVPHVNTVDLICKIIVLLNIHMCWPSPPDWRVIKYSIFRVWYTVKGEEKTYNQVADIIAKDKYGIQDNTPLPSNYKPVFRIKTRK